MSADSRLKICIAVKRIYVHESIYNQFRDKVVEYIRTLKVNTDDDAFMGPVQNKMQFERVNDLLHDIGNKGYLTAIGEFEMPKTGYFIKPTIADNPPEKSRIVQEEPFGEFCRTCSNTLTPFLTVYINYNNRPSGSFTLLVERR